MAAPAEKDGDKGGNPVAQEDGVGIGEALDPARLPVSLAIYLPHGSVAIFWVFASHRIKD